MQYPLPSYAASIWVAGDTLWLAFPPSNGHQHGHSIHLSADNYGFQCALTILREREIHGSLKINQPGAQSQHLADEMLKAMKRGSKVQAKIDDQREIKDFLKEIGLWK